MAAGCVPVVSNLGCFTEFIQNGVNGVSFDHRASDAVGELAAALLTLIQSAERRSRMQHAAWTTARNYTLPKIANELIADFSSVIEPTPALATSVIA
jgi:glycosyltransferase involved in cell wall biosynthesis